MSIVGAFEAKTHLSALLESVAAGEEVTITKRGKAIAKLVPIYDTESEDRKLVIANLKKARKGSSLSGLSVQDLRNEGRR